MTEPDSESLSVRDSRALVASEAWSEPSSVTEGLLRARVAQLEAEVEHVRGVLLDAFPLGDERWSTQRLALAIYRLLTEPRVRLRVRRILADPAP